MGIDSCVSIIAGGAIAFALALLLAIATKIAFPIWQGFSSSFIPWKPIAGVGLLGLLTRLSMTSLFRRALRYDGQRETLMGSQHPKY